MLHSKGWHSRGYLPHFDSPETVQFVTFRLADSLPASAVSSLQNKDDAIQRIDVELDGGRGGAGFVATTLRHWFKGQSFILTARTTKLLAWCLMPNHMHVVFESVADHELADIGVRINSIGPSITWSRIPSRLDLSAAQATGHGVLLDFARRGNS